MALGPYSQVHQSIHCEVLAPAQGLPKILEPWGELGACNPLRGEKRRGERWDNKKIKKADIAVRVA